MKLALSFLSFIVPFALVICFVKNQSPAGLVESEDLALLKEAKDSFKPAIYPSGLNIEKVVLGKKLYLEKKLSKSGTLSCNSCHGLDTFGVDNEPTSPGHDGTRGDRNSPTSFNAEKNIAQFWDGRAKNLEEQALGPLLNPIEHGFSSEEEVLEVLNTPEYIELFQKAYANEGGEITFERVGDAIAEFERTLVTRGRWDQYLEGDLGKLSLDEKRGLNKFIEVGCISCHSGENIGGESFQKLGAVKGYHTEDLGRYAVTKNEEDKHVFKVPNLRNIDKTAPYFHDGSIKSLDKAIRVMAEYQLGEELSDKDVYYIKSFLKSLTGKRD